VHLNELVFILHLLWRQSSRLCVFAAHHFKLELLASAAVNHTLFRRHRTGTNRIKKERRAFLRGSYVIDNGELMCLWWQQFIE
jgi:hypothetical protein